MNYSIENDFLKVTVDTHGAELVSVLNKETGDEMLWDANPAVWNRHAPILFPYCGKLKNGVYTLDGETYKGGQHGFARDFEHECISAENGKMHLVLSSNEDTRRLLPRDFKFETIYTLEGRCLRHTVKVTNTGDKELRFGLGYHPGFVLPFDKQHTTEDYELRFDTPQTPVVSETCQQGEYCGLCNETSYVMMENSRVIPLHDRLFDNDSIAMTQMTAKTISICEKDSDRKITVGVEGYPNVLIWSMPGTPTMQFICVEPWVTLQDPISADGDWNHKECAAALARGESWQTYLDMTFDR